MANGNFGGGNGGITSPFLIEDVADLRAVRSGLHYKQVRDIDLADYGNFTAIVVPDIASYDGNGFKIINPKIVVNSTHPNTGIFSYCPLRVENLDIINATVRGASTSTSGTGVLAGIVNANAIINNVTVSGIVTSSSPITNAGTGGLIGISNGAFIANSTSHCSVTGVNNVGCLLGRSSSTSTINCRVESDSPLLTGLSSRGNNNVGGFIGSSSGDKIAYCSSIVTDISGVQNVGGLIGSSGNNNTSINDCESYGGYVVGDNRVGGLIGSVNRSGAGLKAHIENVISRGVNVEGVSSVGGLIGYVQNTVDVSSSWCYVYYPRIVRTRGTATSFYDLCANWSSIDTVTGGSGYVVDNLEFYSRV